LHRTILKHKLLNGAVTGKKNSFKSALTKT